MKKITRCVLGLAILFSSCTKEPNWARNYGQPLYENDLTGVQAGGNISWHEGMSDEECIRKIKSFDFYDPSKPIFLSPTVYDLSKSEDGMSVPSPNPNYMLFPHAINSMSSTWSHGYIDELKELYRENGNKGVQMFLDKYLQGDSTLGMKLKPLNWLY
tara:strand:+ start:709 stop:1182 length:474 start_codon:yes stop_codon:yes gene_type:complete